MLDVLTVAVEAIFKKILEKATEAIGKSAARRLTSNRTLRKLLAEHLQQTTLRLSRLVAYRPSPQQIEEVYIQPVVMDEALSLADIDPKFYDTLQQFVAKLRSDTPPTFSLNFTLTQFPSPVEQLIQHIKTFSPDQIAKTDDSFVILGEAGAGKSSLLQFICYKRIQDLQARLPIFIESIDLLDSSVTDILTSVTTKIGLDSPLLRKLGGSLSVYVDGLDELEPTKYLAVCRELSDLVKYYPEIVICAAIRSSAYHGELSFLSEKTLLPFDEHRAISFVEKWFGEKRSEKVRADTLIGEIRNSYKNQGIIVPAAIAVLDV